ncbi:hypothetical protein ACFLZV_07065, partial [Candidatus Margulisiibacteriota bacterium]
KEKTFIQLVKLIHRLTLEIKFSNVELKNELSKMDKDQLKIMKMLGNIIYNLMEIYERTVRKKRAGKNFGIEDKKSQMLIEKSKNVVFLDPSGWGHNNVNMNLSTLFDLIENYQQKELDGIIGKSDYKRIMDELKDLQGAIGQYKDQKLVGIKKMCNEFLINFCALDNNVKMFLTTFAWMLIRINDSIKFIQEEKEKILGKIHNDFRNKFSNDLEYFHRILLFSREIFNSMDFMPHLYMIVKKGVEPRTARYLTETKHSTKTIMWLSEFIRNVYTTVFYGVFYGFKIAEDNNVFNVKEIMLKNNNKCKTNAFFTDYISKTNYYFSSFEFLAHFVKYALQFHLNMRAYVNCLREKHINVLKILAAWLGGEFKDEKKWATLENLGFKKNEKLKRITGIMLKGKTFDYRKTNSVTEDEMFQTKINEIISALLASDGVRKFLELILADKLKISIKAINQKENEKAIVVIKDSDMEIVVRVEHKTKEDVNKLALQELRNKPVMEDIINLVAENRLTAKLKFDFTEKGGVFTAKAIVIGKKKKQYSATGGSKEEARKNLIKKLLIIVEYQKIAKIDKIEDKDIRENLSSIGHYYIEKFSRTFISQVLEDEKDLKITSTANSKELLKKMVFEELFKLERVRKCVLLYIQEFLVDLEKEALEGDKIVEALTGRNAILQEIQFRKRKK